MTLTSWLKYNHEIKKMIIYVNVMLIYVNKIEKKLQIRTSQNTINTNENPETT